MTTRTRVRHRLGHRVDRLIWRGKSRLVGTLTRVRTPRPVAALTFDDGPDAADTPRFLEVLERHGARGTFFMLGQRAAERPELVRRAAEAGHVVANHSWDHPEFPAIGARERRRQILRCAAALAPHGQRLFRPPKTLQSLASHLTLRRLGYDVVGWSVEVADWREDDVDRLSARLIEGIRPGGIVVLHDTLWNPSGEPRPDRGPLIAALEATFERLREYRFVTVPQLLGYGPPVRVPWFVRTDADWPAHGWKPGRSRP